MNKGTITKPKVYYFNSHENYSVLDFSRILYDLIISNKAHERPLVILCIGTDRATGDCLGPIVGHKLKKKHHNKILLYGTLDQPVHAQNLNETIDTIYAKHSNAFIIAIDASLGSAERIGYITLGKGSLLPGAGVNKKLTPIGDIFITGIVNFTGVFDSMLLQTTRLNIVVILADFIYHGLNYCYENFN